MEYQELFYYLENLGKDPARLIFEDELTGLYNRRFLHNYFQKNISWDSIEEHPVSLLMMDLDHFKTINDTHGHDAGDQALIYVANLLREAAGEKYLPIRYAGDEFMVLLPQAEKSAALSLGEKVIRVIHKKPLHLDEETAVALTLSIGVASAPVDARDQRTLIQKADTALYYAKKAGRNRLANAGDLPAQDVFVKTAMHQLERTRVAGRKTQLAIVAEALKRFSQRQSQFLIAEGVPGMGKSMFLETILRSVSQSKSLLKVKVSGTPQELFRPYYLFGSILFGLLSLREDKGEGVFKGLSPVETSYLSPILPQLRKEGEKAQEQHEKAFRESVFKTLMNLTNKIVDSKPLVILIDDLHFCDEATLLLLRQMMLKQEAPLFICGAATDTSQEKPEGPQDTLARFLSAYGEEIRAQKVPLSPLNEVDITHHLRGIFPRVNLPRDFAKELEQVTRGNPLFLNEIVRKLVLDGKITLSGQQWIVQPLEKGYLPRSLEDVVRQKISALDNESRTLLDQASIFGDSVSLSALTGSGDISEAKILEFVDKAVSQGLVSSDFQMNDENIRFLSRRVLDITYGGIRKDLREELHERVGTYQETLYERDLLPSAATLAFHFKHSANQKKARAYEEAQVDYNRAVFNAAEAISYVVEGPAELRPKEIPLDAEAMAQVPNVLRTLLLAIRNTRLYPAGSKSVQIANQQAKEAIDRILAKSHLLSIFQIERALTINGKKVDISEFRAFANSFLKTLEILELKGIVLKRGLNFEEFTTLVQGFGRTKTEDIQEGFWQRFLTEKRAEHVELTQVHYALRVEGAPGGLQTKGARGREIVTAEEMGAKLDTDAMSFLPELIRSILNAGSSIKLYPLNSKATEGAIDQLVQALRLMFTRRPAITLARLGDYLLANDEKVDTADFDIIAKTFLNFIDSLGLKSISFLKTVSKDELKIFVGALGQLPSSGLNESYWRRLAGEQGITGILFDQRVYETRLAHSMSDSGVFEIGVAQRRQIRRAKGVAAEDEESVAEEPFEALLDKMPLHMSDLLLKNDEKKIKQIIRRIFKGYLGGSTATKQKVIARCQGLMTDLNVGIQNQMAKFLVSPLLLVLSQEEDPKVLKDIGSFLYSLVVTLIQFAEYSAATRILLHLHRRYRKLQKSDSEKSGSLAQSLVRPLEPKIQQLIMGDFRSTEPSKQQSAAQLLGGLGSVTVPLLIDIIKGEEELRVRRLAASLLAERGYEAAKQLKKQLVLQTTSEERSRILEVIDGVTRDLRTELTFAIHDESQQVQDEGFRLAERLNTEDVHKLLLECVESEKPAIAAKALKSLGRLRPAVALEKILSLLKTARGEELLVASCQTLGQIGDPAGVDMLGRILSAPGFLFFGKKYGPEVRATAAFALTQVDDPVVDAVLAKFVNDKDARVSEIARSRTRAQEEMVELNTHETPALKK